MTAVTLVNAIYQEFGTRLPLQVIFDRPRISDLAARIAADTDQASSRLVPLHDGADGPPILCWPGLGGYPMNLRLLARETRSGRPFYGVQSHGINPGEEPHPTIEAAAAADVVEIQCHQRSGPYTLLGYSFGARVAFEAARQLERSGEKVSQLLLVCPGSPRVSAAMGSSSRLTSWGNTAYLAILCSIFTGTLRGPDVARCLAIVKDEDGFVSFIDQLRPELGEPLIRRITRMVSQTYQMDYRLEELDGPLLTAPVTILKAAGDDNSSLDDLARHVITPPTVLQLDGDHYGVLKPTGVAELAFALRACLAAEMTLPHQ